MIGVRLNNFNETSMGEPEQDANSALTELDKGLRSAKVGEQCEAIVRFPRLFEKYPFPILINSSFLKLADVFRMGNNFLRLWVLRVCQQSEKHLDKILNVDEFLRRVFSVLHSNDPVARALALKTLGAVAGIIAERQNVHHAIRKTLDSQDNVEVDAAIYATTQFAAHSNAFAISMCNKLSDMVECENTGAERRAKLVRALRTVHGGAVRAHAVLKLLRSLLERFPSSSTVRASISALTFIANDTVVHVPDQVELLLSIAVNDPRAVIRRTALQGLKVLAEHAALWSSESIQSLVLAASTRSDDTAHTMLCLDVMQILVKCPAVCVAAGSIQTNEEGMIEPSLLRKFCSEATLSVNLKVASTAADVLTTIVVHCHEENLPVEGADLMLSLESLVIATGLPSMQNNIRPLRIALRCLVQLSNAEPTKYAARTARVLGSQLKVCKWNEEGTRRRLESILEALGALGGMTYCPLSIRPAMPAVIEKLNVVTQLAKTESTIEAMDTDSASGRRPSDPNMSLVLLCTVACQERAGAALVAQVDDRWETQVRAAIAHADGWTKYRVARAALRYGHHQLASSILQELVAIAPSEATHRWLSALHRAASADATLIKEGISGLSVAAASWERAGGAGGAGAAGGGACAAGCPGCGSCGTLCAGWMLARAGQLAALAGAAAAARVLCTQPPPAIAHLQTSIGGCSRAGTCVSSVRRAARSLTVCAEKYGHIASTAFHADDSTLRQLHISQHTCNLLAQFLERIVSTNEPDQQAIKLTFSGKELKPQNLEEKIMLNVCDKIEQISNTLFDDPATKPGVTHRHMTSILRAITWCAGGACWSRGIAADRGGDARCRVSLSAGARQQEHHATLPLSHYLTLSIEGVLLPPAPGNKRQKQRQVKGVQLTVTAAMLPRNNEKHVEGCVLTAVQTVCPVRDFFSAQQLVTVPTPGMYCVAVAAALVDEKQQLWNTGPRTSILVKAHEDPSGKSNSQTSRSRF